MNLLPLPARRLRHGSISPLVQFQHTLLKYDGDESVLFQSWGTVDEGTHVESLSERNRSSVFAPGAIMITDSGEAVTSGAVAKRAYWILLSVWWQLQ